MRETPVNILKQQIQDKGWLYVNELVSSNEKESYYLDFKRVEDADYSNKKRLQDSEKKNLARAISGFGNSEGGLIVWGISTKRDGGSELADSIQEITGVDSFVGLLEGQTSLLVVPQHTTVEHIAVYSPDDKSKGVAVSIVPRSDKRPHQNALNNDFRYYLRSGDSFSAVPDGILRGMFGEAPQPDVIVIYNSSPAKLSSDGTLHSTVGVSLINKGFGIARDIYGHVRLWTPSGGSETALQVDDQKNYDFQTAYGIEMSYIAKPDFRLGTEQRTQAVSIVLNLKPPFEKNLEANVFYGCTNHPPVNVEYECEPKKLEAVYEEAVKDIADGRQYHIAEKLFAKGNEKQ